MSNSNRATITTQDGRAIGYVEGKTFFKSVRGSAHFFRKLKGIAVDTFSVEQARQAGAVKIVITDQETGCQYRTTIAHLRAAGRPVDFGYNPQLFLSFSGWVKTRKGKIPAEQIAFWEGV
jgi:hypothetical protein